MISDPLDEVMGLKQKAVVLRNRNKLDLALAALDQVVARLDAMRAEAGQDPRLQATIQAELADTHGMKGGVNRRRNDLAAALANYRAGLAAEGRDSVNTYNLGNVIVLSIVLGQAQLDDADLRARIQEAVSRLEKQTAGGRGDEWWAWADLGQFRLLSGDADGARQAFVRGRATGPSDSEYQRPLDVMGEIADAMLSTQPDHAQRIRSFVDEMRKTG